MTEQELITQITAQVLARVRANLIPQSDGVFPTVDEAVAAAQEAYEKLRKLTIAHRETYIQAIRDTALQKAQVFSEMAVRETGMGRVEDKIIKNQLVANKTPGTEDLRTEACWSGDHGLTIVERGSFGVIAAITPTTNPTETIICNGIGMIAAGNTVIFSPHPTAKETSLYAIREFNKAIVKAGGPENLMSCVAEPSIEAANELIAHPGICMIVATGGPAVVKAVLSSGKKAIGAGAGNPPVVVDETADIAKAARDIILGSSFDNNLPCIAEKEVIAVGCIADELIAHMRKNGAYLLEESKMAALIKLVFTEKAKKTYLINKKFVGKDASFILSQIGIQAPDSTRIILCETGPEHPFVMEELMMPILPLVQVKDVDAAIELAVKVEHGNRHTAIMHSKNVDHMTRFARAIQTTIFVKNAPSYAGIGVGGEGFTTFTIAGPTGEGLTSARTFTRQRRCVLVDAFSIV